MSKKEIAKRELTILKKGIYKLPKEWKFRREEVYKSRRARQKAT